MMNLEIWFRWDLILLLFMDLEMPINSAIHNYNFEQADSVRQIVLTF